MGDKKNVVDVPKVVLREVVVKEHEDSADSSVSGSSVDEIEPYKPRQEIPAEYWHIQKLMKYIKTGNQSATVVCLCCLRDYDLTSEISVLAVQEIGGLEILVNLLETKDLKCKLAACGVLSELSTNIDVRKCVTDLGGVELLVQNLAEPARDLQVLVAETIYNVAQIRKARKHLRKCNGIPKLVDFLDVKESLLKMSRDELSEYDMDQVHVARAAARALWSVSRSAKNIHEMLKCGVITLLARLIRCDHMDVVVPSVGTISQCAHNPHYQLAIQTEGMVKDIVRHLFQEDEPQLRRYCAVTIFKCGHNSLIREMVRQSGGLDPLVKMIRDTKSREDKPLMTAVTGAIWMLAKTKENVQRFDVLKTVECLVRMLENIDEDEDVLSNVVGALSEFVKFEHNREALLRAGGIPYLVNLLNYTYTPILENVPLVLRESAYHEESMGVIEDMDGVRLVWSLLRNDSKKVQANSASCLVPCVRNASDSGEMVRCFVGGLELIVNQLKSDDNHVLACTCAAIAEVAQDIQNLAIITDHGVVPLLVNLVPTEDVELREHLASAIAYCSAWGSNCKMFGRLGAITPLVQYMADDDPNVHRTTALALFHLSKNAFNCITMHESGVMMFLLRAVSSRDHKLQEAAAGCLANIRKLALEAETVHLIRDRGDSSDEG
ncbi:unnamed protein product [Psylliodes chrysocephalus]|uniref:Armadillo repeat-containing protein gudu n=1 Tax=Psylliodes chrysocephalus TaxID=3402493 RepID=A0A9P0G826_9CUCU|nr:unnamed protein product [Psylliodes chrysocephala]